MEYINTKEILNQEVTVLGSSTGYKRGKWVCKNLPLSVVLGQLTQLIEADLRLVSAMEYHSKLPRYYIVGTYKTDRPERGNFYINDASILTYSNLMTIDIDEKDNPDIDIWSLRERLFNESYVFSLLKSVSGHGYYAIIPIMDGKYTKEYYDYIIKLWKYKFNINVDDDAKTLTRARILSYDEDYDKWIKKDTLIQKWELKSKKKEEQKKEKTLFDYKVPKPVNSEWEELTNKAMQALINDGYYAASYGAWYHLGCELKNFDNGYDLFYKSSCNAAYNDSPEKIKKKWDSCTATGITNDLIQKWCGMAKNKYGKNWINIVKSQK